MAGPALQDMMTVVGVLLSAAAIVT